MFIFKSKQYSITNSINILTEKHVFKFYIVYLKTNWIINWYKLISSVESSRKFTGGGSVLKCIIINYGENITEVWAGKSIQSFVIFKYPRINNL